MVNPLLNQSLPSETEFKEMKDSTETDDSLEDSLPPHPKLRLVTTASSLKDLCDSAGSPDNENDDDSMIDGVPFDSADFFEIGMMITVEDGLCQIQLVPDFNFPEIHPHVYAPANLENMQKLYGGGSGVAVFGGHHPALGDIVMKHGGYKDAQELFALATISEELKRRGGLRKQAVAALDLQNRLPCFKMIYISPNHIKSRGRELLSILKNYVRNWSVSQLSSKQSLEKMQQTIQETRISRRREGIWHGKPVVENGAKMHIYEGENEKAVSFAFETEASVQHLSLILPEGSTESINSRCVRVKEDGYKVLYNVVHELIPIMSERLFKFTLAQKSIGGSNPKTGNQLLYEGKLVGRVVDNLMDQFISVIRSMQALTLPEEVDVVDLVRREVERFEQDHKGLRADDISDTADSFVGKAIKKNFHPQKGRQHFLREICAQFREGSLILMPEEELPARHLGKLLESGAIMSDTFIHAPMDPTVLQLHPHFWRNILRRAVDGRQSMSKTALTRVWTCGLTDAGIHNLFVSETELYLFDLGEPELMSVPGFLTKFLFSFFHTLGMEDDDKGSWVRRFVVIGDKLALSQATLDLLPQAYEAFEKCLDRIIEELLDNDREMRWLLLEYVTMQLLSDTAFCLQKWQLKGGGKKREGNHQKDQEKWLWRAIWDIYVAFDINTADSWYRFDVEHPHFSIP